jgi:hypothetical protein
VKLPVCAGRHRNSCRVQINQTRIPHRNVQLIRPGLDVHCYRSRLGIADRWHLVHRQDMRPGWQQSAIAMTLYHSTYGPAVDLQTKSQVPSEIRHSVNNKATRRVMMIGPIVTGPTLCNSSGANRAQKTKTPKKVPREAVFWFHDRDYTRRSGFSPAADATNFHPLFELALVLVRLDQFDAKSINNARTAREHEGYRDQYLAWIRDRLGTAAVKGQALDLCQELFLADGGGRLLAEVAIRESRITSPALR